MRPKIIKILARYVLYYIKTICYQLSYYLLNKTVNNETFGLICIVIFSTVNTDSMKPKVNKHLFDMSCNQAGRY